MVKQYQKTLPNKHAQRPFDAGTMTLHQHCVKLEHESIPTTLLQVVIKFNNDITFALLLGSILYQIQSIILLSYYKSFPKLPPKCL